MEEGTHATSEEVEVKLSDKIEVNGDEGEVPINGDSHEQRKGSKEEYDEETFDGEFIKVERESLDAKSKPEAEEETSTVANVDSIRSTTNINLTEVSKKIEALELQVEIVSKELQQEKSEKALLKSEIDLAETKLEKMGAHCEELELVRKRMKEQVLEAEEKHSSQLQSLEEALGSLDVNQKELVGVKEAFTELSTELEDSRKKLEGLEAQLLSSAGEASKFEELSIQRTSHAELESKRALEFEKLLEMAKLSAKEMEDQMGSLQEELKGLNSKIIEYQNVEKDLNSTKLELSILQEKLDLSQSQAAEFEQELTLRKVSEEQLREAVRSLEDLLSASKEDLEKKAVNLEEVESKLQHEIKAREIIEDKLKNQETQSWSLTEELKKVTGEKEALEITVSDLNDNLSHTKELCIQLEDKLNLVDQNFNRTDSLLLQVQSHKEELEEKLKSLEVLHHESRTAAESTTQKNLELQGLVQASNASEDGVRAQLREAETRLISTEERNVELEQQLSLAGIKCADADREIKELNEKAVELTTLLRGIEEENVLSKCHFQASEDRISQLESSLSKSYSRISDLEMELNDLVVKCAEHEGLASSTHQRSLELEDLIHTSHSKAEDARKKASEFELLLETTNFRTKELEQLLSNVEANYRDAETEALEHYNRASGLLAELEAFRAKSESLESTLQLANEKERELMEMLSTLLEEKKKFEDMSNASNENLSHAENLIEALQQEMKSARVEQESVERDLGASGVRESEILEKLKSAEEQLEHQERALKLANARALEIENMHESLIKDSQLKLQEAAASFHQKDLETKQLDGKLKSLEEEASFFRDQATESAEKVASQKAELEANAINLLSLGNVVKGLETKISELEEKSEKSILENELLAGTNSQIMEELTSQQSKVNELHELLKSIQTEKEETAEQLASHVNAIATLTDEHSRGLELRSTVESQLHEAIGRFTQRDSEARDLDKKLLELSAHLRIYEEQVSEATSVAENRKVELEEAMRKIQKVDRFVEEVQSKADHFETENDGLAKSNLRLSQELAAYETKMNELQMTLNAVTSEKEDTLVKLQASRETIEDVMQQLASDKEKLQTQVSSLMGENNVLNQMNQDAKKELDYFKTELSEKPLMQAQIQELKQQLVLFELKYKEEIESVQSAATEKETILASKLEAHSSILHERDVLDEQLKELQKELKLAHSTLAEQSTEEGNRLSLVTAEIDELKRKLSEAAELEKKVTELENKLQLANTKSGDQVKDRIILAESKDTTEVKSRDFGLETPSPSKRKSKKRTEGGAHQSTDTSSSIPAATLAATTEPSGPMAFKFIIGIALISVIIGVILGKRY